MRTCQSHPRGHPEEKMGRLFCVMLNVSECLTKGCENEESKTETYLHKHLGATITLGGSAVHRHGLPVTGELKSDVLLHEMLDHLLKNKEINVFFLNG